MNYSKFCKVLFMLVLLPYYLFGQKVYIEDMMTKMKCSKLTCLSDFLTSSGFNYHDVSQYSSHKVYWYASDKMVESTGKGVSREQNLVSFDFSNATSKPISITLLTNDRNYFSAFVQRMSNIKFTEEKSETTKSGNLIVDYHSALFPEFSLRIVTSRQSDDNESWTHYEITLKWK